MKSKNSFVILLAFLSVAGLACQTQRRSGAPAQPVRGGTMVVAVGSIDLSNPAMTVGQSKTRSTMLIYQGLVSLGSDLVPRPDLAESFEPENDGSVWRFTLRKVQWHDGRPLTSADVKFTFENLLLEFHPRTRQVLGTKLESIETPDERTVVFRLKQPFSALPLILSVGDAPILPKHIFEGTDPKTNPANEAPIGTGPFKFVSYQKDAELRLSRNTNYFREGLPYLDEVVFRVIPDGPAALQTLERGEVDIVDSADAGPDLQRLKDNPEFRVVVHTMDPTGANCGNLLGFNLDRPLFGDRRLRRAIGHGIDRQRLVDQIEFGYATVYTSPLHSGFEWAHAEVDYPKFDQKQADQLLTDGGWLKGADGKRLAQGVAGLPDGAPLRFELSISRGSAKIGQIIQEQLDAVGVEVIVVPDSGDLTEIKVFEKREFDTFVDNACQGADPETGLRRTIHSSAVTPVANTNGAGYRNPKVDSLLDEAAAELDQDRRRDLYRQLQEILAEDMPYVWLLESTDLFAHTRSCVGMRFDSADLADRAYCRR